MGPQEAPDLNTPEVAQELPTAEVITRSQSPLMRYFGFKHLPPHIQPVSEKFFDMATWLDQCLVDGPEKTVALRKLLESKDCAVRANLDAI